MTSIAPPRCPQCGALLAGAAAVEDLCSTCLLSQALSQDEVPTETVSGPLRGSGAGSSRPASRPRTLSPDGSRPRGSRLGDARRAAAPGGAAAPPRGHRHGARVRRRDRDQQPDRGLGHPHLLPVAERDLRRHGRCLGGGRLVHAGGPDRTDAAAAREPRLRGRRGARHLARRSPGADAGRDDDQRDLLAVRRDRDVPAGGARLPALGARRWPRSRPRPGRSPTSSAAHSATPRCRPCC